jgi:hypothetical protein
MFNLSDLRSYMEHRLWTLFSRKSEKHRDFLKKLNKIPCTKGVDLALSGNIDTDTKLSEEEKDFLVSEFEKLLIS